MGAEPLVVSHNLFETTMKRIRLAAATVNQIPLDWTGNSDRILNAIAEAQQRQVTALCLPELAITGYGCEDMFLSPHTWQMAWQQLERIVPATQNILMTVGLPVYFNNGVYNCVAVVADGQLLGLVPKQHLAGDGLHYEPRWFRAWPEGQVAELEKEQSIPFGDLIFDVDGVRFGLEICEDAWVAGRPGNRMAERGVDVILNPSASHFAFDKHEIRKRFVLEASRAFAVSYVYANLLGNEAGRAVYDGGSMIAEDGHLVAVGSRFGFHHHELTIADVDIDLARTRKATIHAMPCDVTEDDQQLLIQCDRRLSKPNDAKPSQHISAKDTDSKSDEFTRALSLALFDYMRKSYSCGFVVSMSGGADSSAVGVLVRCMAERAIAELGWDGFCERLNYLPQLKQQVDIDGAMQVLFVGVYQGTRNSSETTLNAANAVTKAIGGAWHQLDIDPLVEGYRETIAKALGHELTWEDHDITLQNIQARTRSPSIWMFANLRNALLLSTSNRSEAAVGYATMDGDTSGGLSPIAGIDKAFLRQWLVTMETTGAGECAAIPDLKLVNQQQPTAELRPAQYAQTDEGDLMPYPLLDQIEQLAIGNKLSPSEILTTLQSSDCLYSKDQLVEWISRFFRLWTRNQWKRERYAPSFHVDDRNLDPRTWCRFPILSSGFREELDQLGAP